MHALRPGNFSCCLYSLAAINTTSHITSTPAVHLPKQLSSLTCAHHKLLADSLRTLHPHHQHLAD
jgi:hypothetical protein